MLVVNATPLGMLLFVFISSLTSFLSHQSAREITPTRSVSLFVEQIFACMHGLLQRIFVHILIVSSKCDAVGSFPACVYPFSWETTSFLSHRSAREITPTRLVICRAAREIAAPGGTGWETLWSKYRFFKFVFIFFVNFFFFILLYYYYLTIDMCVLYIIIKPPSAIKTNIYNRPIVLVW